VPSECAEAEPKMDRRKGAASLHQVPAFYDATNEVYVIGREDESSVDDLQAETVQWITPQSIIVK
jgi:hypothetical protein